MKGVNTRENKSNVNYAFSGNNNARSGNCDQTEKTKRQTTDQAIHIDKYSAIDWHDANYSEISKSESDNSDEEFLITNSKQKKAKKQCRIKAETKKKSTHTNTKINKNCATASNYLSRANNENTNPFQDDDEITIPTKLSKLNSGEAFRVRSQYGLVGPDYSHPPTSLTKTVVFKFLKCYKMMIVLHFHARY